MRDQQEAAAAPLFTLVAEAIAGGNVTRKHTNGPIHGALERDSTLSMGRWESDDSIPHPQNLRRFSHRMHVISLEGRQSACVLQVVRMCEQNDESLMIEENTLKWSIKKNLLSIIELLYQYETDPIF